MPATIFSGNNVKALKSNLDLNGVTKILSVNADPASGAGVAAPLGSIAMDYLAGKVYKKTGSLDTEWQELGSGIGGINYIENSDAESGTSGWSTYADAAGSAPVDGTGGTANITWSRSTTSPLRGVADFNLVKDAVNRQGQGVSYDFTIDSADQAKILTISADYEVLSGTFATGDLAVYVIQDPAGTPVVLQPAGYQVTAATVGNKVRLAATFQTASNVTSYRLCIHVASTSASAYTLALDSIAVSPQQVVYGAPVTDWQSYTMPITATTTNPTKGTIDHDEARWRRVGDSIEIQYSFRQSSGGSAGSGTYLFGLPSGISADSAKISSDTGRMKTLVGNASIFGSGSPIAGYVKLYNSTNLAIVFENTSLVYDFVSSSLASLSGNREYTFIARVPVAGWSSSVVVSSSTDTRVVAAKYKGSVAGSAGTGTPIRWDTKELDTHNAVTTGAGWKFTAPVPGIYRVSCLVGASTSGDYLYFYKNGVQASIVGNLYNTAPIGGSGTIELNAGDYLDIRPGSTQTILANSAVAISIERLSGPSQIAASETVAARYTKNGSQVTAAGSVKITSWTKDYDSHSFFDSANNLARVPIQGKYRVEYKQASTRAGAGSIVAVGLSKNSGAVYFIGGTPNYSDGTAITYGADTISCNAGDTIEFYLYSNAGATVSVDGYFTICRVGN